MSPFGERSRPPADKQQQQQQQQNHHSLALSAKGATTSSQSASHFNVAPRGPRFAATRKATISAHRPPRGAQDGAGDAARASNSALDKAQNMQRLLVNDQHQCHNQPALFSHVSSCDEQRVQFESQKPQQPQATTGNFNHANYFFNCSNSKTATIIDADGSTQQQQQASFGDHFQHTTFGNNTLQIDTKELNFGEMENVWLVKSWREISLRVMIVAPIVLLGIVGNLTIIYSMCKFKRFRSKPTNIFILNMALADLLTTIVCPNAALFTDIYQFYVLGAFICRFEGFIKITCLLVSAYSLIVLSFDWFLCVVQPCRKRISIEQSWWTLGAIWFVSILMASPLFVWRNLRQRQWRDLVEVWCCEQIQYTKYYWVGITFCLIYLPTFIMTIVLVVILLQMDRFEAKLRRSRAPPGARSSATSSGRTPPQFAESEFHSRPASLAQLDPCSLVATGGSQSNTLVASTATSTADKQHKPANSNLNGSLSISIKYRRRIVKILFTYLLTSIICWSPLQFSIIYRHFRSQAVPAVWFFELAFYSQIFASLSGAMNPVIFGYLSQPFRSVVTKSWMFRLFDKFFASNSDENNTGAANGHRAANRKQQQPIVLNKRGQLATPVIANGRSNASKRAQSSAMARAANQRASSQRNDALRGPVPSTGDTRDRDTLTPRLTLDFVEPRGAQPSLTRTSTGRLFAESRWQFIGGQHRGPTARRQQQPEQQQQQLSIGSVSQRVQSGSGQAVAAADNNAAGQQRWLATDNTQVVQGSGNYLVITPTSDERRAANVHRSDSSAPLVGGRKRHSCSASSRPNKTHRTTNRQSQDQNNNHNSRRVSFNTSTESLQVVHKLRREGQENGGFEKDADDCNS